MSYVYDGNGFRVKKTENGVATNQPHPGRTHRSAPTVGGAALGVAATLAVAGVVVWGLVMVND